MQEFAEFFNDLMRGIELVALSLAVGGVAWGLFVLRAWRHHGEGERRAVVWCIWLLIAGAATLALAQLVDFGLKAWILTETLGRSPFPELLDTVNSRASLLRVLIAAGLAGAAFWLRRKPGDPRRWVAVGCIAIAVVVDGAWLVHAESRTENRGLLMALTTVHQLGAAMWVGGVAQLVMLWRARRHQQAIDAIWPLVVARFSAVGVASVLILVTTGTVVAWNFVGSWQGLIGTAYGGVLLAKVVLLATALGFAWLNFTAARRWARGGGAPEVRTRTPFVIESEAFVLVALLFAAAALGSQPPAVDTGDATATWSELVQVFSPKWPQISSPAHAAVLQQAAESGPLGALSTEITAGNNWSDFNHNISGLFLLVMAVLAMANQTNRFGWTRHWPLGFVGLALFLLLRSDPETWPLGPVPFLTSLMDGEVLQHRLATLLALSLGLFEWRARSPKAVETKLPYVFPVLCLAGGLLLLTHSHNNFVVKSEYLVQISHIAMGVLAILMACGRWLELRLMSPTGRVAGFGSVVAMLLIGALLAFYQEPPSAI